MEQYEFDYWDIVTLPPELIKNFDTEYDKAFKEASVDTKEMQGFFATKVKQLLDKYRKWNK